MTHPLLVLFVDAAHGRFPDPDGKVEVLPPLPGGLECSVAFTGHAVVATTLAAEVVLAQGPDGFGGSLSPRFLSWLAGPAGWIGVIDCTVVHWGLGGGCLPDRSDLDEHPRVRHARALRTDVRVCGDERGFVTVGAGIAGRTEISVEVAQERRGRSLGPELITEALRLVPQGEPVFAAVSPGNARSLRAFLQCGFTPVGSEVVIGPDRTTT